LDNSKFISSIKKVKDKSKSLTLNKELDLYNVTKAIGSIPFKGLYSIDVSGLENVPEDGPVILAANHRSFMDSMFIPHVAHVKASLVIIL
jgi:1-acyl-sn-glycerol-3-phosphate acyltransferase